MKKKIVATLLCFVLGASMAMDKVYTVVNGKKAEVAFTATWLNTNDTHFAVYPHELKVGPGETNHFVISFRAIEPGNYANSLIITGFSKVKTNLVMGVVSPMGSDAVFIHPLK